jgi:hypothetical protein
MRGYMVTVVLLGIRMGLGVAQGRGVFGSRIRL